jgi:hypothetical protein
MPPELRPLLAIVIVLAIMHALLKVRARAQSARSPRGVRRAADPPIDTTDLAKMAPEDALARLRDRARDASHHS